MFSITTAKVGPYNVPGSPSSSLAVLLLTGEELDQVTEFLLRQNLPKFLRHAGQSAIARLNIRFLDCEVAVFLIVNHQFGVGLFLHLSGKASTIVQRDCHIFPTLRDFGVRHDDRFENVTARFSRADARELWSRFAALAVDLMAARTEDLGTFVEKLSAFVGVAAFETFSKRGKRIVLWPAVFVFPQKLGDFGSSSFGSSIKYVELQLRRG